MGLKARVKATGEIVDIYRFVDTEQNEWIDCYLDFLEPIATDYWTRLEHQYAGMAMQGVLANADLLFSLCKNRGDCPVKVVAIEFANACAHALVEKYKKEEMK